jgi:hypothetical protein
MKKSKLAASIALGMSLLGATLSGTPALADNHANGLFQLNEVGTPRLIACGDKQACGSSSSESGAGAVSGTKTSENTCSAKSGSSKCGSGACGSGKSTESKCSSSSCSAKEGEHKCSSTSCSSKGGESKCSSDAGATKEGEHKCGSGSCSAKAPGQ